jgi:hypothetical protein
LQKAVALYNDFASENGLPTVQKLTGKRKTHLKRRLKDAGGLQGWSVALSLIKESQFLLGANKTGFTANFDFLMQEKSFVKLMEGGYQTRESPQNLIEKQNQAFFERYSI